MPKANANAKANAEALLDLAAVLLFVGIGRVAHTRGLTVTGLASTAWPFVSGLAAAWLLLALAGRWTAMASFSSGLVVWLFTVGLGMVLRVISGQGIAVAFVFVALGFLGATMLGWRVLAARLQALRRPHVTSDRGGCQG